MNQKDHCLKAKLDKVLELMKFESVGKIMTEFGTLTPKTYSYLTYDNDENENTKDTKKVCHKTKT